VIIDIVPLAQTLSQIVAVPESAIEYGSQALVPQILLFIGELAVQNCLNSLAVALGHGVVAVLDAVPAELAFGFGGKRHGRLLICRCPG
jgi:hypothetical protein